MKKDFLLPDLGEGLEEGEIVTWRVSEGDHIELNQPLVEVNTAKALVEIPSPFAGTVVKLHAAEGDVVLVGKPLVTIDVEAEDQSVLEAARDEVSRSLAPAEASPEPAEARPKRRPVLVGYGVEEEEPRDSTDRSAARGELGGPVAASPPVRRLAKDLGIDLAAVVGTGPGGRITREDVEKAAGETEETAGGPQRTAEERIPVRGTRRLIAEKMARSVREIPHVTTFLTVNASYLDAYRGELQQELGERIRLLPIVVRALVETCKRHPKLNASFDAKNSEIVLYRDYHVGVATDTERGLIVPVVRGADGRGIVELSREIARLSQAAREGSIGPEELVGSTITVTNVGTFGAEFGTPVINFPEAAILAVGVVEPRALVVDDEVRPAPAMTLSLSFDHRLLDGAEAGRTLRDLGDLLESPFRLGSLPR